MSETLYLAGTGHSDGGFHQMEVFDSIEDAKEYVESIFNFEKEWTTQPDLAPGEQSGEMLITGETLYYGFEEEWKGFVKQKELNPDFRETNTN